MKLSHMQPNTNLLFLQKKILKLSLLGEVHYFSKWISLLYNLNAEM